VIACICLYQHLKKGVSKYGASNAEDEIHGRLLTFVVRHELWDGNIHDHAGQGVSIAVAGDVGGKETTLLRFNCFDQEKSYVYGPENPNPPNAGPTMSDDLPQTLSGSCQLYRMDPIADGNPIGWTIRTWKRSSPGCWNGPDTRRSPRRPISPRSGMSSLRWKAAPGRCCRQAEHGQT
jgi:hypothetical protein